MTSSAEAREERRDVVVVGASAGGVEALTTLVSNLPAWFGGAILIVLHMPEGHSSALAKILGRSTTLPVHTAEDGEPLTFGTIALAPADRHLLLETGTVRVVRGPRENGFRPAIDPLFRSAARAYGERVVGVVLSGTRNDGCAGLSAVKRHGGLAIVQDPDDALFGILPRAALETVEVDKVATAEDIGGILADLAGERPDEPPRGGGDAMEEATTNDLETGLTEEQTSRPPSSFTCPECNGALWELKEGTASKLTCRIGHSFTPEVLFELQGDALEATLWSALRALEERADLADRLAGRMNDRGQARVAQNFRERVDEASYHAAILRKLLLGDTVGSTPEATGEPS
jgi:two-component system chemotaxis response regulator CheB